jgi:pimeloyl-ACP methyl ester carboxylesterase
MKENLLILQGALGSKSQFESLKSLLSNSFNVLSLNFEGHGGRTSNRDFSISNFKENVIEFLEAKGIDKIKNFGFSMGGYVALNLAHSHPEKVISIITLGTKFDWTPESAQHEIKMLDADKIQEKVPAFANVLKERHHPQDWKMVLSKTAEMMIRLGNGEAMKEQDFSQISIPVKIMIGGEDKMVSISESKQIADWLSNSEFKIIANCQHPIEKVDLETLKKEIF